MRTTTLLAIALTMVGSCSLLRAQDMQQREERFVKATPRIGDPLPDVTVYAADGTPLSTRDLRGHYSVLTFGCLT